MPGDSLCHGSWLGDPAPLGCLVIERLMTMMLQIVLFEHLFCVTSPVHAFLITRRSCASNTPIPFAVLKLTAKTRAQAIKTRFAYKYDWCTPAWKYCAASKS